jgi:hypothetical protein
LFLLWRCHGIVPRKCGCRSRHVAVHPRRSVLLCHESTCRVFVATASVRRRYVDCPQWQSIDRQCSFLGRCSTQRDSFYQLNPRSPAKCFINRCANDCNSLHQCPSRPQAGTSHHRILFSSYRIHPGPLAPNESLYSLWHPRVGSRQKCCYQEHDNLDHAGYC